MELGTVDMQYIVKGTFIVHYQHHKPAQDEGLTKLLQNLLLGSGAVGVVNDHTPCESCPHGLLSNQLHLRQQGEWVWS